MKANLRKASIQNGSEKECISESIKESKAPIHEMARLTTGLTISWMLVCILIGFIDLLRMEFAVLMIAAICLLTIKVLGLTHIFTKVKQVACA